MKNRLRNKISYQIFMLPAFLLFTVFTVVPLIMCLVYSFTNYSSHREMDFVGLENYIKAFQDELVRNSIGYTLVFTIVTTLGITALSLIVAILFARDSHTGGFQRAVFYFPSCISLMVAGYAWRSFFASDENGLINKIICFFGGNQVGWLSDSTAAQIAVIIVAIWFDLGWCAVLFYAYIQSIDPSLYEVAKLDGANGFQKAWYVTIPMIVPAIAVNLTVLLSQGLKVYEIPQSLTKGGPVTATYTMTHAILVRGVTEWKFGEASAIGVLVLIITAVLCLLQIKFTEKGETEL
ncbi:carbohydrate ABC transporter permease [Massiliimalia massiliensis]|uniref:carbohydrate ABC transporter permease n=1 Tax=Massiliimalia massiliensis TaxID=1852384 RepID=UPI000986F707|nr:sugar ABC transporter permease [Massiliimalia massiliensis]